MAKKIFHDFINNFFEKQNENLELNIERSKIDKISD